MPSTGKNLRRNRKAASPAVSMVIITAATIVLVLVSANYAMQVLARQQGLNEYDTVKKSLLTFDDAFRDIAFDRGGSRSVRFTMNHGYLKLLPTNATLIVTATGAGFSDVNFGEITMGAIQYHIPTSYVTYGYGYSHYVLGDKSTAVTSAVDSLGRLQEKQFTNDLVLGLDYRVRVTREGPSTLINGVKVNYVDILVVRMNITKEYSLSGSDFDLTARNLDVTTRTFLAGNGAILDNQSCKVIVNLSGEATEEITLKLDSGQLVFNLIVADVKVGV